MRRRIFLSGIMLCVVGLTACVSASENDKAMQETEMRFIVESEDGKESTSVSEESAQKESAQKKSEQEELQQETSDQTTAKQGQWITNISSDIPKPFIEVLEQYAQFMNAENQDLNDERVREKWYYLYNEWSWLSRVPREGAEGGETTIRYALVDLTGDDFPELVMGDYNDYFKETTPSVIYHYSEKQGIGMECATCYFTMSLYEGGIVEYISAGMYSTTTYLQFEEDAEEWVVVECLAEDWSRDSVNHKQEVTAYYREYWVEDELIQEPISEAEYLRIQEMYTEKPIDLEWVTNGFSYKILS